MGRALLVPLALLVAGVGLVVDAVARGGAAVALLVVVPVVYGASTEFLIGVVLLLLAFLTLPLALMAAEGAMAAHSLPAGRPAPTGEVASEISGLVLVGPVPIFFGGWKHVSLRTRIAVAAIGAALLAALIVVWILR